jgi:hypothetical protein
MGEDIIRFAHHRSPDDIQADWMRLDTLAGETHRLLEKYSRLIGPLEDADPDRFQREKKNIETIDQNTTTVRAYLNAPHQTSPEGILSLISTLTNNLMFLRSQMNEPSDGTEGSGASSGAGK